MDARNYKKVGDAVEVPNLVAVQTDSYRSFLQLEGAPDKRKNSGLEAIFRETFPILSYDGSIRLEYLHYELGRPRYTPDECRKLGLTYGRPLTIFVRLVGPETIDEGVYLGDMPIMMGGGEFIINGAERVIVSQLHRSPGVDFEVQTHATGKKLYSCRIIPERGSWIELSVSKKDVLSVKIDQSGKFPATTLLRCVDEKYGTTEDLLRLFYETKIIHIKGDGGRTVEPPPERIPLPELEELVSKYDRVFLKYDKNGDPKGAHQKLHDSATAGCQSLSRRRPPRLDRNEIIDYIVPWKFYDYRPRAEQDAKDALGRLSDEELTELTKSAYEAIRENPSVEAVADVFERMTKLLPKGARSGVASAILAFCFPEQAAVIDPHVWHALDALGFSDFPEKSAKAPFTRSQYLRVLEPLTWLRAHCTNEKLRLVDIERGLFYAKWAAANPRKSGADESAHAKRLLGDLRKRLDNYREQVRKASRQAPEIPTARKVIVKKLVGCIAVGALVNASTAEIIVESGGIIDEPAAEFIAASSLDKVEVIEVIDDPLILDTIAEDHAHTYTEALERIYKRLRPGNPFQLARAQHLFHERFFDANRYRLGRVGRFRLNRKFNQNISENEMTLRPEDLLNAFKYLVELRESGQTTPTGVASGIDDIDHLGNRRVRTIDELAGDELRKGLLKLRRTAQERMSMKEPQDLTPRTLINPRTVSAAIDFFFGRSELSQVVDQVNPLAQLTHERRLSALGPGGLNRKRAGFEVRDVHTSHYGRICPIETPEGTNIGLIVSLSIFAQIDEYGFLVTPYRKVKNGRVTDEIEMLRADEEDECNIAPADVRLDANGRFVEDLVMARAKGEFKLVPAKEVDHLDVSPKQLVGISAALIPFLENDDANRALMGSNMQRQAVPLLMTEPPLISTGMEEYVAQNSGMVVVAAESGTVRRVTADEIVIDNRIYTLRKFVGLSSRTCLNQKPIVQEGDRVKKGQVIADGSATKDGRLALGKNVLVGFMPFDGYNFEDAILISENLVKKDTYTSVHIDEFEIEVRETKLGREEFTRDIPNVPERALRNLDESGVIRTGTYVRPGDILVGKIAPKSKTELSPEEKLLHAIFGRAGEDVKNESLEVPSGVEGIVVDAQKFSRKAQLSGEARAKDRTQIKKIERDSDQKILDEFRKTVEAVSEAAGGILVDGETEERLTKFEDWADEDILELEARLDVENLRVVVSGGPRKGREISPKARRVFEIFNERIEGIKDQKDRRVSQLKRGDELPPGVLEMVKVYVATTRTLSVGDKMAGRHGNKGVIARILPEEDMPYLEDGTPVEIVLNPLGVPSRMNLGQIYETHLGWAAKTMGYEVITPVFDGATEPEIRNALVEAGLPPSGKARLYDGRTGMPFDQEVTVGYMYMLKLEHLVDDKVHARATGPYSLITQQPLGGKARSGGQRFGEMEVWALEAYGAAHILQELLTVKSDDVEGRTRIYEAMVKGENSLQAGTPVSFDVLVNEIKGLGLNIKLEKSKAPS